MSNLKTKSQISKVFQRKKLILIVIIVLAFGLRIYRVGQIPPGLYWDEAAMALDAKSIALTSKDHHGSSPWQPIFPSWGDYKLPAYIITAVPFFKMMNQSPELAIRLPSVLAGTSTVILIYFLSKELFNKPYLALTASFLLAISPWHLQFSRAAFEGNLALFFNALALLCFLKARNKKLFLFGFIVFSTLGIYTYYSARIVLPIIIILTFVVFWEKDLKNILPCLFSFGVIFFLITPLRASYLVPQAEQLRLSTKNVLSDASIINYSARLIEEDNNSLLSKKIHHRFLYQAKQIADHLFEHLSGQYLLLSGDSNLRHSTGRVGVLFLPVFIGFLLGQYHLFKKSKKLFLWLNLCLMVAFLPACIPYEVPHSLRSLNAVVFLNLIAAYGWIYLNNLLKEKNFLFVTFYLLLFTQFLLYLHDYYIHYPSRSYFYWQGGYKEAVARVNREYQKAEQIIFTDFYSRPYLYFLLYSDYPLQNFQEQRNQVLNKNPLDFLETKKIDKIEFRSIKFEKDKKIEKVLLIGTPKEVYQGVEIKKTPNFVLWKNY